MNREGTSRVLNGLLTLKKETKMKLCEYLRSFKRIIKEKAIQQGKTTEENMVAEEDRIN